MAGAMLMVGITEVWGAGSVAVPRNQAQEVSPWSRHRQSMASPIRLQTGARDTSDTPCIRPDWPQFAGAEAGGMAMTVAPPPVFPVAPVLPWLPWLPCMHCSNPTSRRWQLNLMRAATPQILALCSRLLSPLEIAAPVPEL